MFPDRQLLEHHRKRLREEDDAEIPAGATIGFTEHRSKRLQSLPLRTSPVSKRWADPPSFPPSNPTFTKSDALRASTAYAPEMDEASPEQHMWADEPELGPQISASATVSEPFDSDMDMMDTSEPILVQGRPGGLGQHDVEPGSFQAEAPGTSITGRMPTPIHCSFAAQVRGNNWNGACGSITQGVALATTPEEPNDTAFSNNGQVNVSDAWKSSTMSHGSVPRSLGDTGSAAQAMADWSMVMQNRRLPSPISECGGEDSLESPRMVLDSSSQHNGHLNQLAHEHPLLAGLPPRASSAVEGGRAARESEAAAENHNGNAMDVEAAATPSPKKGHTRSKHTLTSWTALQPGMKRSFSIGYRADCEKCRMKVPGHFNHIIIS
ncbi:hypothetical protein VTK56DRAFT_5307 [Thermocarpiscus australiensis]